MMTQHYTAQLDGSGKWFYTFPGGQSSHWLHKGTCQRFADEKRQEDRKARREASTPVPA